jgi:pimeloyl-ACP methyl ester carboxylesterase
MLQKGLLIIACVASLASSTAWAAPTLKMVRVEKNVRLEVLDWGGSGSPLIFLSGFGGTAHTFEGLAEKFTGSHHVYAITRRGFGHSSHPQATPSEYSPERLGADVVAVIRALHIKKPFLAGHSLAGQELSEIGTRYPDQTRGLIYLDAADAEAFYGPSSDVLYPIAGQVRRDLEALIKSQPSQAPELIKKIKAELPRLERGLDWYGNAVKGVPDRPANISNSPEMAIQHAIVEGSHIYGPVKVPVLSIVALPIQCAPDCNSDAAKRREKAAEMQAADFSEANPKAKIVRIPYADHFVWQSNERTVVAAMTSFMNAVSHLSPER